MSNELLTFCISQGTAIALILDRESGGNKMDEQKKIEEIKKRLEGIAAEVIKLAEAIQRIRRELERMKPPVLDGK
jgi:hypothetical protein